MVPQIFNGGHTLPVPLPDTDSVKPGLSLLPVLKQKPLTMSASLQNLSLQGNAKLNAAATTTDARRWSFDEPCDQEKAAIVAALERSVPLVVQEKDKMDREKEMPENLISSERNPECGEWSHSQAMETAEAGYGERQKGWFSSKDSHSKPR